MHLSEMVGFYVLKSHMFCWMWRQWNPCFINFYITVTSFTHSYRNSQTPDKHMQSLIKTHLQVYILFFYSTKPSTFPQYAFTLTHPLTHLAPSVSFKCCYLCRDLHAQITLVFCFANQMIHNCLSLHTFRQTDRQTDTHTHENRVGHRIEEYMSLRY